MKSTANASSIYRKLQPSDKDISTLKTIDIDPKLQENDFYDYSKVVVRKPWGYEYLIFANENISVWILYIKKGAQTSLHCHPHKKTSIMVLSGSVSCATLENERIRNSGEGMLLGKGVFHRTAAQSEDGTFVMEIETPVNKRDLVRFKDDYGREKLGYESSRHMSFNLQNYNYTSFIDSNIYYNVKWKFGSCSIALAKFTNTKDFDRAIRFNAWDAMCPLKGRMVDAKGHDVFQVGDIISKEGIASLSRLKIKGELQAILVKKSDVMTRLSDFVVAHLKHRGIKDIFFVPETSNAHLVDAIGRDTGIRSLAFKSENAAALAAEAYAKLTGKPCVIMVAAGSSGTNAITGVANAWIDSTPVLVISAQSRFSALGLPGKKLLRQLANKELDTVNIVNPITKYVSVIHDSRKIKQEVDHALFTATYKRHGPVWLDIPIDVLGTNINESKLKTFKIKRTPKEKTKVSLKKQTRQVLKLLKKARRPVILAGFGIRASGAQDEFLKLASELSVPVLTSRRGIDLLPEDFPFYFGRPGTYGQRAANFIIQNCDLLLCIGARLSLPLIGRNYNAFAREAKKIIVDIDPQELKKITVPADIAVCADAGDFIRSLRKFLGTKNWVSCEPWLTQCRTWKKQFPVKNDYELIKGKGVNPYLFIEYLSEALAPGSVVVVDGGPSLDYLMQTFQCKKGGRVISSPGLEYEGFAIPAAIGAYLASEGQEIICLCGKKGLESNISELQTIVNSKLPVKIFCFLSKHDIYVQRMQASYFGGRYVGTVDTDNNFEVKKIGAAYGIACENIGYNGDILAKIDTVLQSERPVLCVIDLPDDCQIIPRMVFSVTPNGQWISKPLEDMYPFLDRKKFKENMVIKPWHEK